MCYILIDSILIYLVASFVSALCLVHSEVNKKWSYWVGCVDFRESVKFIFGVGNQVLLLGAHAEQRLWKHNQTHSRVKHTSALEMGDE